MTAPFDLDGAADATTTVDTDVCIVGAGAAGLYLARRLSAGGTSVVMLEAGGRSAAPAESVDMISSSSGEAYGGAREGRAFGWGGTSTRWGGVLVPYTGEGDGDRSEETRVWRHVIETVHKNAPHVRHTLGLKGEASWFSFPRQVLGPDIERFERASLVVMAAETLPFRLRNLTRLAAGDTPALRAYLNAAACEWSAVSGPDGGTVRRVVATSPAGRRLEVTARTYVLAAGAIESARILLEMDRATNSSMLRGAKSAGELCDHLSWKIAEVSVQDRELAARRLGPRFDAGVMRSLRFIQREDGISMPRHFAHVIFDVEDAGYAVVRALLSGLQSGSWPLVRARELGAGVGGLSKLAYHRYVKRRLFIPPATPAHLQLDIEQASSSVNRVVLSAERDRRGRAKASVHWQVSDQDHANVTAVSTRFLRRWPVRPGVAPRLIPIQSSGGRAKPWDAYHPVRTCRMGDDAEAVVDYELRARGTSNLYVLNTGIFPSAGSANPTFSLLCFAEALADRLRRSRA